MSPAESNLIYVFFTLQHRDWRHQKKRPTQARPPSKKETQKEDRTLGRRHHGCPGSVLRPAGTGEGVGESVTDRDGYLSHLHDSSVEVEAGQRYSDISVSQHKQGIFEKALTVHTAAFEQHFEIITNVINLIIQSRVQYMT